MFLDLPHLGLGRPVARPSSDRVLVVNGHPDSRPERFCAALCKAFLHGARLTNLQARELNLGSEKMSGEFEAGLERLWWADRLFIVYPLWFGGPPPALSHLFEVFVGQNEQLGGGQRWAEIDMVITASLPSLFFRSRQADRRYARFAPRRAGSRAGAVTIIGSVGSISKQSREQWLTKMRCLGSGGNEAALDESPATGMSVGEASP